jgi:DNA/RNA non-specific endonuclease
MSWLGSVVGGLTDAGRFVVHGAEDGANAVAGVAKDGAKAVASGAKDGAKAVASGVEDGWKSAFNDAKAAAGLLGTGVRSLDAAKDQFGSWIDSGEKDLTNKIDEGRAWLRQHGGVAGQIASDQLGFAEGVGESLYGAGKGVVQLADTAGSLANPIEWAANPSANIARVKSTVNTVETLGRIANLASPASWMTDPQGNEQLAGALWHSAARSFENDPSKFIGNAAGTIGTLFIPGADVAGVVGDVGKAAAITGDVGKAAAITGDIGKAAAITGDVGKAAAITGDVGKAAAITGDVGKATAITGDVGKAATITQDAGRIGNLTGDAGRAADDIIGDAAKAEGVAKTVVKNGYTYTLDAEGRTTRIEGDLVSNPAQGRSRAAQLAAGGPDRLATDEGGHFVARRFDGPLEDFNHFAQNGNFNRGAYKALENEWQRALDRGSSVNVDITAHYPGDSLRPDSIDVTYTVDGVPHETSFLNRPGGH